MTLEEAIVEIKRLAAIIDVPQDQLPRFVQNPRDWRWYIEIDADGYHILEEDRGTIRETITTPDDFLYRIFERLTSGMAGKYELAHRNKSQDSRRIYFARQQELMAKLSADWAARLAQRLAEVLRNNPFDDNMFVRLNLVNQYRKMGDSPAVASAKAIEKLPYPEPSS